MLVTYICIKCDQEQPCVFITEVSVVTKAPEKCPYFEKAKWERRNE